MPSQPVPPHTQTPAPATITPALLKQHSITADEYARIESLLGRTPSLTELGIFSVMWSEHCSYKSSRVHLKRLPTKSPLVVQGPGENAGIIDVGDGWACAFKIESHNHPSYIEPYQGAATGVGGILRDIFTMNARPLAVMDSLRFGPLSPPTELGAPPSAVSSPKVSGSGTETDYTRNRQTMTGVVAGVAGYGNCFGVPNLGGETRFEPCYSGNPLVNAFALGLVRIDEIFYAKATGVGNPVIYVGAKTGRDGIHGATMASEEFTEGSEQKRPNVQMGDPFLEKLLLEACLEAMATGAVLGIQDMGAAGLTCSTCEMGARGELGLTIELDLVPQRETGMSSYEIMLSESQERMLLVADKGREHEVLAVFAKWGLDASIVGTVTADDIMRVTHHGELVCEIPNKALTDDAPVYHRPVGTWKAPVPLDPPAWVLEELKKPRDYTADLKKLLASTNICSKRWVYEQYDSMVQTNTVQGPGGEAGVIRIKGTGSAHPAQTSVILSEAEGPAVEPASAAKHSILDTLTDLIAESTPEGDAAMQAAKEADTSPGKSLGAPSFAASSQRMSSEIYKPERGLAMALAGNGRWCYLDPKLGAMHAVAEAARKVACTGAKPVAATNCLNFGNPEKPEIMAQLSAAIDGIAEACTALGTPITGGNVSLYNETRGEGIYPTPVIGIVGILEDVTKAVPAHFQHQDDDVLLLIFAKHNAEGDSMLNSYSELGSSEFAKACMGVLWGAPPSLNLKDESNLQNCLVQLANEELIHSACDVSDGGIHVALAKAVLGRGIGFEDSMKHVGSSDNFHADAYWREESSTAIVSCSPINTEQVIAIAEKWEADGGAYKIGSTVRDSFILTPFFNTTIAGLSEVYSTALESQLADEVLTA